MNKNEVEKLRVFLAEKLKDFSGKNINHEAALCKLAYELEGYDEYEFDYEETEPGDWLSEGKYMRLHGCVVKLIINNIVFYATVISTRSGVWHKGFDYQDLNFACLETKKEFNEPIVEYTTHFEKYKIDFMNDNKVKLDDKKMFFNFDFAMKYILANKK